jgi:Tat protein secretion system quality control protein TatD with DNase activity
VVHVARKVAEVWGVTVEEVAAATTANARRLFRLP